MRVVRLELFGFKSFMDKTVLPLDVGMTGVVGPNGCGKSNVVDALRWVLGETRASTLRGSVLEDVIFNGTDKLRPLGLAEVTLTIRSEREDMLSEIIEKWRKGQENSQGTLSVEEVIGDLAPELGALEATKSIEDAAVIEAEKIVAEGSQSELVSPPKLVVLEGGKGSVQGAEQPAVPLDSQPSAVTPKQGVSADEDPGSIDSLAARFGWLKGVQEVQLTRRLYRSGESEYLINRVTSRLRDVRELCRALGVGARAHTIVAQGEVARIVTSKPEERRTIIEEAAGVSGLRERVATTEKRLDETSQNLARLNDIVVEVERQVASLKRQASLARARVQVKARLRELDLMLAGDVFATRGVRANELEAEGIQLAEALTGQTQIVDELKVSEEAARNELIEHERKVDELRLEADRLRDELNRRLKLRSHATGRLNELRGLVSARQGELGGLAEREQTLEARKAEAAQEAVTIAQELSDISGARRELETGGDQELKIAAEGLDQSRRMLRQTEDSIRAARELLVSHQAALREVESQIQSLSPLSRIKKTIGDQEGEIFATEGEAPRLLADVIQVQSEYVKALQAVLAERAACVVADDPYKLAARILGGARSKSGDLPSFGAVKKSAVAPEYLAAIPAGSPLVSLRGVITADESVSTLVDVLLAGVAVVGSLDEAFTWFAANPSSPLTLVTTTGDIVTSVSFLSHRHEGGIIQLRAKSRDLGRAAGEQEVALASLHQQILANQAQVEHAKQAHEEALRKVEERRAKARELAQRQGMLSGRLESAKRAQQLVDQDVRGLAIQKEGIERRLADYQGEESTLKGELAAIGEEGDAELQANIETASTLIKELEQGRVALRARSSEQTKALSTARDQLDTTRSRLSNVTLERDRLVVELSALRERLTAEYGAEIFAEIPNVPVADDVRPQFAEELQKLRARIAREGEIDPTVIARFEEEEARLLDLRTKRDDLTKAAETLKETAARLREAALRRFMTTFEAVRENFGRLVTRLYGGGHGTLELSNPAEPLESGVDINVRPPGKKPKSIDVLSGGEKALCATALLFSLFLERPSPLCVLDEVDAPLDEANLVRFVSLVKEMSSSTQFIVITHNKGSMQAAERLVGVTMQQPGASTLITVSLQEAYKAVA